MLLFDEAENCFLKNFWIESVPPDQIGWWRMNQKSILSEFWAAVVGEYEILFENFWIDSSWKTVSNRL